MTFQNNLSNSPKNSATADFFFRREFIEANFKNGKNIFVSIYFKGESTSVKLKPRKNYTTFYKTSVHGGVLVFEYTLANGIVEFECYSPIWLFGIRTRKLYFKENPSSIFKYLKEGYLIQQEFINFLSQKNK